MLQFVCSLAKYFNAFLLEQSWLCNKIIVGLRHTAFLFYFNCKVVPSVVGLNTSDKCFCFMMVKAIPTWPQHACLTVLQMFCSLGSKILHMITHIVSVTLDINIKRTSVTTYSTNYFHCAIARAISSALYSIVFCSVITNRSPMSSPSTRTTCLISVTTSHLLCHCCKMKMFLLRSNGCSP